MNCYIQDICCFCLGISNEKCRKSSSKYADNLTPLDMIKTVFSGLSTVMESDDRICMKCSDTVGFIYEFQKTCSRNINIFSSYKKILEENQQNKQCALFVDLNEWKKFKENTLTSDEIKIELPDSPLNNDDMLDDDFVSENHEIGAVKIKEEIVTCDGESETIRLDSEIKLECEQTDFKKEWINETSDVESTNIQDFENITVQSTEEVVDVKEENKELIEDPLQGVAEEKSDEERGHFEFIGVNPFLSEPVQEEPNHVDINLNPDSHRIIHSERETHTGKESLKCDICGKLFIQKGDLKRHYLIHTGEKPHKCEICGKLFNLKGGLKTHMLIHTGEKPHRCDVCGKFFTRKHDLKTHMVIHTGVKSYKCDVCGKLCSRNYDLKVHKLIHIPYKCNICGELFGQKEELQRHSTIHTVKNEKP